MNNVICFDITDFYPEFRVALTEATSQFSGKMLPFSTDWTEITLIHKGVVTRWEIVWRKESSWWKCTLSSSDHPKVCTIRFNTPFLEMPERYTYGEMSQRARDVVKNTAPYLSCEKGTDMKKIGASEYKKDEARLGEEAKNLLGASKIAVQRGCKKKGIALGKLSEWELNAAFLVKLIARRTITEDACEDFKSFGKIKSREEYIKACLPEVEKCLEYLIGETEQTPRFRVRVFPPSAPGKPVKVRGARGSYWVDKYTSVVTPTSKKETWKVRMEHSDEYPAALCWWAEEIEGEVPREIIDDIVAVMYENFPKGIRYVF